MDAAAFVYDAAKAAARFAKAKGAHDELIAAAHRAQADALEIEAQAKRRLADEYDQAQDRGEVAKKGKPLNVQGSDIKAKVTDLGLTRQQVSEARQIRNAEAVAPGIVRRTLDDRLSAGQEPTKAAVREAVSNVLDFTVRAPVVLSEAEAEALSGLSAARRGMHGRRANLSKAQVFSSPDRASSTKADGSDIAASSENQRLRPGAGA